MSRIGRLPIIVPDDVKVEYCDDTKIISVNGPNGKLSQKMPEFITVNIGEENGKKVISFSRSSEIKQAKANHGLIRSLTNNMVIGVKQGFKKELELVGIGYKADVVENKPEMSPGYSLEMNLGYSHPVIMEIPDGLSVAVEKSKKDKRLIHIFVSGADRRKLGQFCSNIRKKRKVEPYKGKGLRYSDEYVIRKAGKKKV